jgi:hypothetical protein
VASVLWFELGDYRRHPEARQLREISSRSIGRDLDSGQRHSTTAPAGTRSSSSTFTSSWPGARTPCGAAGKTCGRASRPRSSSWSTARR